MFGDVRRIGYRSTSTNIETLTIRSMLDAVKCHGFFGSGDTKTTSNDNRAGASEDAQLAQGQSAIAKDDSKVQGGYGNKNIGESAVDQSAGQGSVATDGAISLGGYANRNNIGGEFTASGANSSITVGSTAADVDKLAEKFTHALSTQSAASGTALGTVLNQLTPLAQSQQTGGVSSLAKTALWALGIAAGALLLWKWNK